MNISPTHSTEGIDIHTRLSWWIMFLLSTNN